MKKITFDFLADMPLKEIDKSPAGVPGGKVPALGADFRLFSDGSIFPSAERIAQDALEFQHRDIPQLENGYDVFLSTDWGQYAGTIPFACIAKVSRESRNVDLFGRKAVFQPDGTPKSTIINLKTNQGLELISYLEKTYCEEGETLFASKVYVDLKINFTRPVGETANKVYNIPKRGKKGKNTGTLSSIRRENILVYPLELVVDTTEATTAPAVKPATKPAGIPVPPSPTVPATPVPAAPVSAAATAPVAAATPVPHDIAAKVFG